MAEQTDGGLIFTFVCFYRVNLHGSEMKISTCCAFRKALEVFFPHFSADPFFPRFPNSDVIDIHEDTRQIGIGSYAWIGADSKRLVPDRLAGSGCNRPAGRLRGYDTAPPACPSPQGHKHPFHPFFLPGGT